MCCDSIFTCIMTMISDFSLIFIFSKLFLGFFSRKYDILLRLDVVLILLLLTVTFFLFKIIHVFIFIFIFIFFLHLYFYLYLYNHLHSFIYILCVPLKKYKTFSYNLFNDIKYAWFLSDLITKLLA